MGPRPERLTVNELRDLFEQGRFPHQLRSSFPEPMHTYHGKAAVVRLYSVGRPGAEPFTLNVCPIIDGHGTSGMTFPCRSLADLRYIVADTYREKHAGVVRDVERCLWRARKQLVLALPITPHPEL